MEIARYWRFNAQRHRLIGDIDEFGRPRFPPREIRSHTQPEPKQELKPQRGGGGMTIFSREASMSSK